VRLRVWPVERLGRLLTSFQFLLVRLRVLRAQKTFNNFNISIPSGAIKSYIFDVAPFLKSISIPSGAIKRFAGVRKDGLNHHFNSFWCD